MIYAERNCMHAQASNFIVLYNYRLCVFLNPLLIALVVACLIISKINYATMKVSSFNLQNAFYLGGDDGSNKEMVFLPKHNRDP